MYQFLSTYRVITYFFLIVNAKIKNIWYFFQPIHRQAIDKK